MKMKPTVQLEDLCQAVKDQDSTRVVTLMEAIDQDSKEGISLLKEALFTLIWHGNSSKYLTGLKFLIKEIDQTKPGGVEILSTQLYMLAESFGGSREVISLIIENMTLNTLNDDSLREICGYKTLLGQIFTCQSRGNFAFKSLVEHGAKECDAFVSDEQHELLTIAGVLRNICSLQEGAEFDSSIFDNFRYPDTTLEEFARNIMTNHLHRNGVPHEDYLVKLSHLCTSLPENLKVALVDASQSCMQNYSDSLERLALVDAELLHLTQGLTVMSYSNMKELMNTEYGAGLDTLKEFYEKNPQYTTPGTYFLEVAHSVDEEFGVSKLNLLMLNQPHLIETLELLSTEKILPPGVKDMLGRVIVNHEVLTSDSALLTRIAEGQSEVVNVANEVAFSTDHAVGNLDNSEVEISGADSSSVIL